MARNHPCQHDILTDTQICRSIRHKAQTAFKQAQTSLLTILVIYHRRQQAGPQRQAHSGHLYRDWAWQDQHFFARVQQGLNLRIDEAVSDRFLEAVIDQHGFHTLERQIRFAMLGHDQVSTYRHVRNIVVAVNACDFFYQVLFDFHIETPARRDRQPVVALLGHLATQTTQNIAHLLARYHVADQTVQLFATQGDGGTLRQFGFSCHIDDRASLTATDINQQAGRTLHRFVLQCRINATLVAM
ncbi:hypothetical protein D3C79_649400 [compost metagenome]